MKKAEAIAKLIESTAEALKSIDEKDWHSDMKQAMKNSIIENVHNPSVEAVQQGKFKYIQD